MVRDKTREAVDTTHFCLRAWLLGDVQWIRKNFTGKVLVFAFWSSQIFLKELPKKADEAAPVSSTQIFVLANEPLRVCEFPTWKGLFGDKLDQNKSRVCTLNQIKLWNKTFCGDLCICALTSSLKMTLKLHSNLCKNLIAFILTWCSLTSPPTRISTVLVWIRECVKG